MSDEYYYDIAGEASLNFDANGGLSQIKEIAQRSKSILDVGCGEGTRLSLLNPKAKRVGIDINKYAVSQAVKKHKKIKFLTYDGTKLPFLDGSFEMVYSAYVLEHTKTPYQYIDEMVRVLKKGGHFCLITPNFGAPNRRSPNSVESKVIKLIIGIAKDVMMPDDLRLTRVVPKKKYTAIDDDTTVEPYLRKIEKYLLETGMKKVETGSLWEIDDGQNLFWRLLKLLKTLYPIKYWGPQAFVCFQK